MPTRFQTFARVAAAGAIALASVGALAAQTVVQSSDYGLLSLPHTQGFNLSLMPQPSNDRFLSDYGFSIGTDGSFSSAVLTFDLGTTFQLSNLTISLMGGDAALRLVHFRSVYGPRICDVLAAC